MYIYAFYHESQLLSFVCFVGRFSLKLHERFYSYVSKQFLFSYILFLKDKNK